MRSQPACKLSWDGLRGGVQHACSHSLSEHATDICVSLSSWITFGRAAPPPRAMRRLLLEQAVAQMGVRL